MFTNTIHKGHYEILETKFNNFMKLLMKKAYSSEFVKEEVKKYLSI